MEIVQPRVSLYMEEDPIVKVAMAARICTGREDKVAVSDQRNFIRTILGMGHESVSEHYRITVKIGQLIHKSQEEFTKQYMHQLFSSFYFLNKKYLIVDKVPVMDSEDKDKDTFDIEVTGNIRAWRDAIRRWQLAYYEESEEDRETLVHKQLKYLFYRLFDWQPDFFEGVLNEELLDDYQIWNDSYASNPHGKASHPWFKLISIREASDYKTWILETSRDVTHQFIRHRDDWSYSQQSQRYCKYKTGVRFIRPVPFNWAGGSGIAGEALIFKEWKEACEESEKRYLRMLELGIKPEEARTVLNNSCYTKIMVTGTKDTIKHFFSLRCDKDHTYPPMCYVASSMKEQITPHCTLKCSDTEFGDEVQHRFGEEFTDIVKRSADEAVALSEK